MAKAKTHFMGIPLERFADRDSYVARRLINDDRWECTPPQTGGVPKTKVKSGYAPDSADVFGIKRKSR